MQCMEVEGRICFNLIVFVIIITDYDNILFGVTGKVPKI